MKRLLYFFILCIATSSLSACSSNDDENSGDPLEKPGLNGAITVNGNKLIFKAANDGFDELFFWNGDKYDYTDAENSCELWCTLSRSDSFYNDFKDKVGEDMQSISHQDYPVFMYISNHDYEPCPRFKSGRIILHDVQKGNKFKLEFIEYTLDNIGKVYETEYVDGHIERNEVKDENNPAYKTIVINGVISKR